MNNEKITPKIFWTALIGAVVFWFVMNGFDIFERISGNNRKIEQLEQAKMDKDDANEYFNKLQTLQATQTATWNQYMLSNEKDKERMLKLIESNQKEIMDLIKGQQKLRGSTVDFLNPE